MRKTLIILFVGSIAIFGALNLNISNNEEITLSSLSISNIEALAQAESGSTTSCKKKTSVSSGFRTTPCNTCVPTNDLYGSNDGTCNKN